MKSKQNRLVELVHSKGYRVCLCGKKVLNKKGKEIRLNKHKSSFKYYYNFSTRPGGGQNPTRMPLHKLQAYQKFGDKMFEEGIVVRHMNDNSLDNSWDNIELGTQADNVRDRMRNKKENWMEDIDFDYSVDYNNPPF